MKKVLHLLKKFLSFIVRRALAAALGFGLVLLLIPDKMIAIWPGIVVAATILIVLSRAGRADFSVKVGEIFCCFFVEIIVYFCTVWVFLGIQFMLLGIWHIPMNWWVIIVVPMILMATMAVFLAIFCVIGPRKKKSID